MGMNYMERCSRGNPCVFCGDVGLDMRMHYPASEDVVHWCHKVRAGKGDHVIGRDSREYLCIAASKETGEATMGEFSLYKLYLSDEEWKEKQRRLNPEWREGGFRAGGRPAKTFRADEHAIAPARPEGELLPREAKVLTAKELDVRYRAILDALVLEDWHKEALLKDWKTPVNDVSFLLDRFPIRSLPPTDRERFSEEGRKVGYKNPTRKSLVTHLYDRFGGALAGTPGLYERDGKVWSQKPQRERWTIAAPKGGILFPCFDKDGLIYRLRLKVDKPDLVIKEKSGDDPFEGSYGYFSWKMDESGTMKCYFVPESGTWKNRRIVDGSKAKGKPRGKYVNFSSFHEQMQEGEVRNTMLNGSQSGSPYGLYRLEGADESLVILTEGEKKGMVSAAICGCVAVSIPGVSNFNVIFRKEADGKSLYDVLVESGAETFVLCYDADKDSNKDVLKAEQKFASALRERGASVMIGSWSSKYDKGLDDLLILGVRPTVRPYQP